MSRYLIVMERTGTGYAAYVPDLPGCITTGRTPEEVRISVREAIELHVEGLREAGIPVPQPTSEGDYVSVSV
jgi:predicted RNase H-like HicB family nuclease